MSDKEILEQKLRDLIDKEIPDYGVISYGQIINMIGPLMSKACALGYNYAKSELLKALNETPPEQQT